MLLQTMKDYVSGYIMKKIIILVKFGPKIVIFF
jgi:hypothetical protein